MKHENFGGSGWGIGLGLLMGIVLALLSLSRMPVAVSREVVSNEADTSNPGGTDEPLAGARQVPLRQSLPARQNFADRSLPQSQAPRSGAKDAGSSDQAPSRAAVAADHDPQDGPTATVSEAHVAIGTTGHPATPAMAPPVMPLPPVPAPSQDAIGEKEARALLKEGQFLIKAGLAPMASEPLRRIVQEAQGTPTAREAQRTLDSLSKN